MAGDLPVGRPLDIRKARLRKRCMKEPGFVIRYDRYKARGTALGATVLEEAALQAGAGTGRPGGAIPGEIEGNPGDIALLPVPEASAATIPISWTTGGASPVLDLTRLFAVRPYRIPGGARAVIPISRADVEGLGHCVILHLGNARFEEIRPRQGAPGGGRL